MFRLGVLIVTFLYLTGCSCSGRGNRTDSEYVLDMMQQKSIKPQEGGVSGDMLMRVPPKGTRARNRRYYPYKDKPLLAEKRLKNPIPFNPKTLVEGRVYYEKFCIYCHGTYGNSKEGATVAPKMVIAPLSLLSDKAKGYSDGRIYHIIYSGQGFMGSYRSQLETKEQVLVDYMNKESQYKGSKSIWSVVHYVRSLQRRSEFKRK